MRLQVQPLAMEMVGMVRRQVGLPAALGQAPLAPHHRVLVASRDPALRAAAKQVPKRLLLNEGEMVAALRAALGEQVEVAQIEFTTMTTPTPQMLHNLQNVSVLLGLHGAAMDYVPFLPRGAHLIEIMPMESSHAPLYAIKAATTGKHFMRYQNTDPASQRCCAICAPGCKPHDADVTVDVKEIVAMVRAALQAQRYQLQRFPFDYGKSSWHEE
jgi:hypothetical protein